MPNLIHTERRSALNAQSEVVNQRGDGLERGTPTPTCHTTRQLLVLSISIYVAKNTFRQLSARSPPHTRNSVAPSALSLPFLFPLSSFPIPSLFLSILFLTYGLLPHATPYTQHHNTSPARPRRKRGHRADLTLQPHRRGIAPGMTCRHRVRALFCSMVSAML